MRELLQLVGFFLLFLRFAFWVGSSLPILTTKWRQVLVAQATEGVLLVFFYAQLFGNVQILLFPLHVPTLLIGFALVWMGVAGAFSAKKQLGDAWVYAGTYRIVAKQKLTTTGIYGIVRHPLYSSIIVSYVGIEVLAGSWLFVSALFLFIPFYFQAKNEEKLLIAHFGKQYESYRKKTKMLVPGIY